MTQLRRFAQADQAQVRGVATDRVPPAPSAESPVTATDGVTDSPVAETAPVEPAPVVASEPTAQETPMPVASPDEAQATPKRGILAEQLLRPAATHSRSNSMRDILTLLKSLSPVLRAALLFPGPEASPAEYADAVRRMSGSVKSLADALTNALHERDPLELDTRWARKAVQEVAAELVSHHWVATVLSRGGAGAGDDLESGVALLSAGVHEALAVSFAVSGRPDAPVLSNNGAVRLSFLKAFAPLAIEVDKYSHIINAKLDAAIVDATALQASLGDILMEQANAFHQALMEGQSTTEDDQRMTLQACLGHVGAVLMALWEPTRGDALGTLVDATSVDEARKALSSAPFSNGFPLAIYQERVDEAVRRLTGTALASIALVRSVGPGQEGDACRS